MEKAHDVSWVGGHYVPVLKNKRGERQALRAVTAVVRSQVVPLLEFVECTAERAWPAYMSNSFRGLAETVRCYSRCLLDLRELSPHGEEAAREIFQRVATAGIAFTPVTGVSRTIDVRPALQHRSGGLALRLTRGELEAGRLGRAIGGFLIRHAIAPEEIDLILDLGSVTELVVPGVQALTAAFLSEVPESPRWRTFTVSASAFPLSMARVGRRSHDTVERVEWLAWRDGLFANRAGLQRLPAYSDAGIQHPRGVEGFDPKIMQVSAAIRYTAADAWLLVKGESTRQVPPRVQFPDLARQLVSGQHRRLYCGAAHCAGCAGMQAAADGAPRLGSPEKWRMLGTIHHITTAVEQLAALPSP